MGDAMILSGAMSTPTTSADMKPLIEIGTGKDQSLIPVRSVRGQFGPFSVDDIHESSSQLDKCDGDEEPKENHVHSSIADSVLGQAVLWKNAVIIWICTLINVIFRRSNVA